MNQLKPILKTPILKTIAERFVNEIKGEEKMDKNESLEKGKALRKVVSRKEQGDFTITKDRKQTLLLILDQEKTRVPELIPIRHERMLQSPFAFFRGAAITMADDLAKMKSTNIKVQACGDAHIANFGIFASPERRLVFDINDFDETLPATWEWDVKRLCVSIEICGRERGFSEQDRANTVFTAAKAYCESMKDYSDMGALDVYYDHMDLEKMIKDMGNDETKFDFAHSQIHKTMQKAITKNNMKALDKLTETVDGHVRMISNPPLIVPFRDLADSENIAINEGKASEFLSIVLKKYRLTLPKERRRLLDQYSIVDAGRKVVGVGSVGTRCYMIVLEGDGKHDPLILQVKEANQSVLEPYAGKSEYLEHGRRVIEGQRAIQTAGDILTGWVRIPDFHGQLMDYYVRQLWDCKGSINLDKVTADELVGYGALCARTLAHAHAKTGNRHMISGYLGKGDKFAKAMVRFSQCYADQNAIDYECFKQMIQSQK